MEKKRSNGMIAGAFLILVVLLVACRQAEPQPTPEPEAPPPVETAVSPTSLPTPQPAPPETWPAQVVSYTLGEATLVQDQFPEDSSFRNMPVRLEGVIGAPESDMAHPVVLILHGAHGACPDDSWPCSVAEEQANYEGFTYQVEALAEAGYVALSINVNAEHTFGFGEPIPNVRITQLIDLHLGELAAANAGESDTFGIDLNGRADLSRIVWVGHSRGGDSANHIVREQNLVQAASPVGYGPIDGLLFVAPPVLFVDALPTVDVPFSVILAACDGDVTSLSSQAFYESARLDGTRRHGGSSFYLEGATHNQFNTILNPERESLPEGRPDCTAESRLPAAAQQAFLSQYTIDFLQTIYGQPEQAASARDRLGLTVTHPAPNTYGDNDVQILYTAPAADRLPLIQPQSEAELMTNLLGGEVTMTGVTAVYCPEGYYVPANEPGSEPCKRVNFNQPGYPQQLVLSWQSPGAEWRMAVPETNADLSAYTALQFRAALDPLSDLNPQDAPQSLTVSLVDADGNQAQATMPPLPYPVGERQPNDFFEGGYFTGQVHMRQVRIPLAAFAAVDLTQITEIALLFDQSDTGSLFLADLELVSGRDSAE